MMPPSQVGHPFPNSLKISKQTTRLLRRFIWIFTTYKPALREPGLLWSWETVDPTERGQRGWEKQNRVLKATLQGKSQRWGARTSPPMVGRMTVIGQGTGREAGESGWRGIWLNLHLGKRQAGQGKHHSIPCPTPLASTDCQLCSAKFIDWEVWEPLFQEQLRGTLSRTPFSEACPGASSS